MKTISKEYIFLFNEMTDASEKLASLSRELQQLTRRLRSAQQRAEELFLEDAVAHGPGQTGDSIG